MGRGYTTTRFFLDRYITLYGKLPPPIAALLD
jgi:hypothetical protein